MNEVSNEDKAGLREAVRLLIHDFMDTQEAKGVAPSYTAATACNTLVTGAVALAMPFGLEPEDFGAECALEYKEARDRITGRNPQN